MLFKLVLTFIAAAHCLPTGYNKHAKSSAERLHALEKELDALKHVAEPQMERTSHVRTSHERTCQKECEAAFGKPGHFFLKWVEAKYGECPDCWDKMGDDKILKLSDIEWNMSPQFKNMYDEQGLVYYGLDGRMENVLPCKAFCEAM